MEIEIPFSRRQISLEQSSKDLKYRAILSRDSLFYGLFNSNNQILHYGRIKVDVIPKTSLLNQHKHEFGHSIVAFNNPIFSLLESNSETFKKSLLKFNHSISDLTRYLIFSEKVVNSSSVLTYAIPKPITKALSKHIVMCDFSHYQKVFLDSIGINQLGSEIHLSLLSGNLNLIYFEKGELQIANCYQVRNESDFYYYIALIYDQYKLKKGETQILMDGDFSEVKLDKEKFFHFFGVEPEIIHLDTETNETNTTLVALTRLNRCASLEEV